MKKMKLVAGALFVVALGVVLTAHAEELAGFRDVPWGASEETLKFRIPTESCTAADPNTDFGTRRCKARSDITFGDIRPTSVWFFLRDNMLVAWQVSTNPRFRETLASALTHKYGKPSDVYEGDHVAWKGRMSDLDFVGGRVQDLIVAVTKAELATREAERQERARRAAKGF